MAAAAGLWLLRAVVAVVLLLAMAGAARRLALWRQGRSAAVDWTTGLAALPRRYLRDLHAVVAREPESARMHVAAAGGVLLASALFLGSLVAPAPVLGFAGLGATALLALGAARAAGRRFTGPRLARRSGGEWNRLVAALALAALGWLVWFGALAAGAPDGAAALAGGALAAVLLAEFAVGLTWGGPMRHAFAGALHLAAHPRPERFGGGRSTALRPLDLAAPRLGADRAGDFAWNALLGFDACVRCGRCEAACPAFAAGQPLNPKALIHDLAAAAGLVGTEQYSGSPHPGLPLQPGRPGEPVVLADATLWSCTTCRACVEACPMMIEHVDAVIDLRRFRVLEEGRAPARVAAALWAVAETGDAEGRDPEGRFAWATDLGLRVLGPGEHAGTLLWVGDAGFLPRGRRTLRALVALLRAAGEDPAILGPAETDCGDTVRRLGDEAAFRGLAIRAVAMLSARSFDRLLTTDPHVLHCIRNEWPALGGHFAIEHHTTHLAALLEAGRLRVVRPIRGRVTYHDPCYLARYNGETEAPRAILARIAADRAEMARAGLGARCCGGGGGAPLADIPGERRIADMRMADARETGAEVLAVACPNCMTMLDGVTGDRAEPADIAELLAEAAGLEP